VPEKIVKQVLQWAEQPLPVAPGRKPGEIAFRVTLTQEEIAQCVGTTRETVSRVLSDFKRRGWLRVKGIIWTILDKNALENMITT
jgi:CRP/FNR family transcriptional regulator